MPGSGPLAGVRIVEIGHMIAVPAATHLLTTQGAEVVGPWYEAMEELVGEFPLQELLRRLRVADVPVAPVLNPNEVADDAQVRASNLIREVNHPFAGRLLQPRPSAESFGAALELTPAPVHGEHTAQILMELGYDEAAIADLTSNRIIKRYDHAPSNTAL